MKKSHKMILAGLAALLVITGIAWKLAAPRVLAGVQDLLLKQVNSSINGRLEIGSLDFSVLGSAVLKQVVLYDKAGSRIASGGQINVSYQFDDLLGGRFGLDSVKKISIEKADLKLAIDKNGRWSLQELVKPQKEQPAVFRGIIAVQEVTVEVTTPEWTRQFTGLAGDGLHLASGAAATSGLRARIWRGPTGEVAHHLLDPSDKKSCKPQRQI